MSYTHWLVVSDDGAVLGWFPKTEDEAKGRAQTMAKDTGHSLTEGEWNGKGWVLDGPQGLKDLLRF